MDGTSARPRGRRIIVAIHARKASREHRERNSQAQVTRSWAANLRSRRRPRVTIHATIRRRDGRDTGLRDPDVRGINPMRYPYFVSSQARQSRS